MARRTNMRIPILIGVEFYCGNKACSGTVTNLSENGMFITSDRKCFPEGPEVNVAMPVKNEILTLPGMLIRSVKMGGDRMGMGVELLDPPPKYLDYVESLLYIL
jgi:hypothetical protein